MVARLALHALLLALLLLGGSLGVAHADDKPWAAGVPAAQQKKALALYREGNEFFQQAQYKEALAKYDLALAEWDHPAIRYNAAVCLINMDRPAAAWDALERALRFGEAPLGKDLLEEARRYQRQLAADTGTLEVACELPGAQVTLDGELLFEAPGRATRRLAKGTHRLVTTKEPEYATATQEIQVLGGTAQSVTITLARREVLTRVQRTGTVRRWAAWKPYALVGAGVLLGGGGAVSLVLADRKYTAGDEAFSLACPSGCAGDDPRGADGRALFSAGETRERAGQILLGVGSAAIITGLVLVVLNQPRELTLAPTVQQPGLSLSGRF